MPGWANVIVQEGLVDTAFVETHTEGFDAVAATVARYTPEDAQEVT